MGESLVGQVMWALPCTVHVFPFFFRGRDVYCLFLGDVLRSARERPNTARAAPKRVYVCCMCVCCMFVCCMYVCCMYAVYVHACVRLHTNTYAYAP